MLQYEYNLNFYPELSYIFVYLYHNKSYFISQ